MYFDDEEFEDEYDGFNEGYDEGEDEDEQELPRRVFSWRNVATNIVVLMMVAGLIFASGPAQVIEANRWWLTRQLRSFDDEIVAQAADVAYFDQLIVELHAEVGRPNVDVDTVLAFKDQFADVYPDVDAYFGAVNAQLEVERAPRDVRLNWATSRETYRLRYQGIMRRLDRLEEVSAAGQRFPDSEIRDLATYVESALPDPFDA